MRRNMWRGGCLTALLTLAMSPGSAGAAAMLIPPDAERVTQLVEPAGSYDLPIGPWADGSMLTRHTEGQVVQTAWRWSGTERSTLELLRPLRDWLQANGWSLLYECDGLACGGFDFRYSTRVLPEPEMHVDMADFRYIAAAKGRGAEAQMISLLVSRSQGAQAGFAQTIEITPSTRPLPPVAAPSVRPDAPHLAARPDIGQQLDSEGRVVLPGLSFASGGAGVTAQDDAALQALADWLTAHPDQSLTLVGHSDSTGSPDANTQLSQRRAAAVRDLLIKRFQVTAERISATGVGDKSPLADNATAAGRAQNRRVEATVTPTR